jgi:hypothetical protein
MSRAAIILLILLLRIALPAVLFTASSIALSQVESAQLPDPTVQVAHPTPAESTPAAALPPAPETTPLPPPAPVCPPGLAPGDIDQLANAAADLRRLSAAAKGNESGFAWDVFVNLFSDWLSGVLFGEGEGGRGLIVVVAAWSALAVALIKLALAVRLPVSKPRRALEVGLAGFLCISSLLGVFAVHAARDGTNAALEASQKMDSLLSSCQSALAQQTGPQPSSESIPMALLQRVEAACTSAGRAVVPDGAPAQSIDLGPVLGRLNSIEAGCAHSGSETMAGLARLETEVGDVRAAQWGFPLKLALFLTFVGVALLVWWCWLDRK